MTLNAGVTDDQLGRFYRIVKAISERLGKSLSFDEVMQILQQMHDGTFRSGCNTSDDLQHFFKRSPKLKKTLSYVRSSDIPEVDGKDAVNLFCNSRRYDKRQHQDASTLLEKQLGQKAGKIHIYKMSGCLSSKAIATELLDVPDETPNMWVTELLIKRGYVLTLPVIEELIEMQTRGVDVGLNRCKRARDSFDYPFNFAFIEICPGRVEVVHFFWKTQKKWVLWREPFAIGVSSTRDQGYLIIRGKD